MPARSFFDLIVGTSAGGIIALCLAVKKWTVQQCIDGFHSLCTKAFTPRHCVNVPVVGRFVRHHHHSAYETKPLKQALITAYGERGYLFGGLTEHNIDTNVAVATATMAGNPVVLSNYNRVAGDNLPYHFQRPERLVGELKIWEAARATSAAPKIFRSFEHQPSNQVYIDGALYYNNPVQIAETERKLIWSDTESLDPDIILSIGTSHNPRSEPKPSPPPNTHGVLTHIKELMRISTDHIENSLNGEQTWKSFMQTLHGRDKKRFVRLNAELDFDPPKLDEVGKMKELQNYVRRQMESDGRITDLAHKLIATCFYFERYGDVKNLDDGTFSCQGSIRCRFIPGTEQVKHLGEYLRSFRQKPYFHICEPAETDIPPKKAEISDKVIDRMVLRNKFELPAVEVRGSSSQAITEISIFLATRLIPISGFPRSLTEDYTKKGEEMFAMLGRRESNI
ncbi:hypothetical protein FGG08_000443 [Glutinoglossum americanum]|uniref:PNPLA domain-containing protein n=1 Tax=Glutinoglossum americanum TaxID=1670608 RepID=A0A9P8L6U8_9PEZI|nr:hypothetical protein FGG08_000443 [Glutinoglossum americanum]